ncbi:hypothetical protein [Megamonas hypermegale]|uniref:hypothetical protein n=1 Tax=Megamonas hypermegale TaxID=158847 RepID=UPI0025A3359E|nr:hypothetical protein [Megamonas hypermegale]MDM8143920.1 hypothetical protein [Megamonas hypermegale]
MENRKKLILIAVIISLMSVLFAGCGDDKYVQTVKNGSLDMAKGVPIGKAFDQFFSNEKWESFVSENNERIVEFNGECRWNNNPATCCVQFRILNDSRFEVSYLDINGVSMNWWDSSGILNKVFQQYKAK